MSESTSTSYSGLQPYSSESAQTASTRHTNVSEPITSKRVCFYKSGDPQFNGIKMVVSNRSFKTFDALLDGLSKRVPLPFGVRNISTPRGIHQVSTLDDLEDGKAYICSHQKKIKPINLERASRKPLLWQSSRPISARRRIVHLLRQNEVNPAPGDSNVPLGVSKKLVIFKNGDTGFNHTITLNRKSTQNFEAVLDRITEVMRCPVIKLYTADGRRIFGLQSLFLSSGAIVAAGREPFKPGNYDPTKESLPVKLPGIPRRVLPKAKNKQESRTLLKAGQQTNSTPRSSILSLSSDKTLNTDKKSSVDIPYVSENNVNVADIITEEDLPLMHSEDDIEKSVHVNPDGTMTVEMKIRLRIKSDETIQWTTTVSRANISSKSDPMICSTVDLEPHSPDFNSTVSKTQEELLYLENSQTNIHSSGKETHPTENTSAQGAETCGYSICQNAKASINSCEKETSRFYRPPTPGPKKVRKKKSLVKTITTESDGKVQENVRQFSYSEEIEDGESKSEYYMIEESISKNPPAADNHKVIRNEDVPQLPLNDNQNGEMLIHFSHRKSTLLRNNTDSNVFIPQHHATCPRSLETSRSLADISELITSARKQQGDCTPSVSNPCLSQKHNQAIEIEKFHNTLTRSTELSTRNNEEKCLSTNLVPSSDSMNTVVNIEHKITQAEIMPSYEIIPEAQDPHATSYSLSTGRQTLVNDCVQPRMSHEMSMTEPPLSAERQKKKRKKTHVQTIEQKLYKNRVQEGTNIAGEENCERENVPQQFSPLTGKKILKSSIQGTVTCACGTSLQSTDTHHIGDLDKVTARSIISKKDTPSKEHGHHVLNADSQERENWRTRSKGNKQLAKVRLRSVKKSCLPPIGKSVTTLQRIMSQENEIECALKSLGSDMDIPLSNHASHNPTVLMNVVTGLQNHSTAQNMLCEVVNETCDKFTPSHEDAYEDSQKTYKKQKRRKKNKKREGLYDSRKKIAVNEKEHVLLQACDGLPEICHHSLESYVQSWLQNIFPNSSLPSHKSNMFSANNGTHNKSNIEGEHFNTCPTNNMQDTVQNKVCLVERCARMESDPLEEPSRGLIEVATFLEDSISESERKEGYLSRTVEATGKDVKDLTCSSIRQDTIGGQQMGCDVDGGRAELKVDIQGINIAIGTHTVDVAVQADVEFISVKDLETSVSNHCISDWFLGHTQSSNPAEPIPASQCQCLQKPLISQHSNSPAICSSPHLLLAWLIVLNLKDSLVNILQNNNPHNSCTSTGILTLLQSLKEIAVTEHADDLKEAVLNLQESTLSYELGKQKQALPFPSPSTQEVECIPNTNESDTCQENYMETNGLFDKEPVITLDVANDSHVIIVKENIIEGADGHINIEGKHISEELNIDNVIQTEVQNTLNLAQDIFVMKTKYDSLDINEYSFLNKNENDTEKIINESFSKEGENDTQMTPEYILGIEEKQSVQKGTDNTTGNEEPHNAQNVTYDGSLSEDMHDSQEVRYAGFGNEEVHGTQNETYYGYNSEGEDYAQGEPEDSFLKEENGANKPSKDSCSQKEEHRDQGLANNHLGIEVQHVTREIIQGPINIEEKHSMQKVSEEVASSGNSVECRNIFTTSQSLNDVDTFKPHSESECNYTEEKAGNDTEIDALYQRCHDSVPEAEYGSAQNKKNGHSFDDEEPLLLCEKTYTEEEHSTLVLEEMDNDISVHGEVMENTGEGHYKELTTMINEFEEKNGGHQMEILENENEGGCIIYETSKRLPSPPSAISSIESEHVIQKQTQTMPSKTKVKMMVQEMEHRRFSDAPFEFRKCLQSPISSDGSDYRQDSDDSIASNSTQGASSEINTESGDETLREKPYKTGFVKRTIERLYGKAEATVKPLRSPKISPTPKSDNSNSSVAHCTENKDESSSYEVLQSQSKTNISRPSSSSERYQRKQKQHASTKTIPNNSFPLLQPINSGEVFDCTTNASSEKCDSGNACTNKDLKTLVQCEDDGGVLIDKGRWLLKENHLVRKSPPETTGMYGNAETTSADTVLDNTSDDVPYSHFKNLNQHLPIADVSSSEVEDLAKPRNFSCNYFSMPHCSDSEPLHDDQHFTRNTIAPPSKTKEALAGKSSCPPQMKVEASGNTSHFTGVDLRLPANKVHPHLPSTSADSHENPSANMNLSNRDQIKEQDSLDKLHVICGQHCPILSALIEPINEEKRGFAYSKASDIENLLWLSSFSQESSYLLGLDKYTSRDENNNLTDTEKITDHMLIKSIFYKFVKNSMLNLNANFCDTNISVLSGEHTWKKMMKMISKTHTEIPLEIQGPPLLEMSVNISSCQCLLKSKCTPMQLPTQKDTNNNISYQHTKQFDRFITYIGHNTSSAGTSSQGRPFGHMQFNQSTRSNIDQNFSANANNCSTATNDQEANISDTESNNEQ